MSCPRLGDLGFRPDGALVRRDLPFGAAVTASASRSARMRSSSAYAGLVVPYIGPGQLRLRGNQRPLAGRLQDAGPVPLQVGLRPPQRRNGGIQPRKLLLNLGYDPVLLGKGRKGELLP